MMAADDAAAQLIKMYRGKRVPASSKVTAMLAVLDRAGLSVRQIMEHVGEGGGPLQMEVVHRLQAARERFARHEAEQAALPAPPKADIT